MEAVEASTVVQPFEEIIMKKHGTVVTFKAKYYQGGKRIGCGVFPVAGKGLINTNIKAIKLIENFMKTDARYESYTLKIIDIEAF